MLTAHQKIAANLCKWSQLKEPNEWSNNSTTSMFTTLPPKMWSLWTDTATAIAAIKKRFEDESKAPDEVNDQAKALCDARNRAIELKKKILEEGPYWDQEKWEAEMAIFISDYMTISYILTPKPELKTKSAVTEIPKTPTWGSILSSTQWRTLITRSKAAQVDMAAEARLRSNNNSSNKHAENKRTMSQVTEANESDIDPVDPNSNQPLKKKGNK